MLGTIANAVAIVLGAALGLALRRSIQGKYQETSTAVLGLAVVFIGAKSALQAENTLLLIIALVVGGLVGEAIGIEAALERLAARIEKAFSGGRIADGFVTTTLIYCVGAMAVMGALQGGLEGKHDILFAKGLIDGVTAIFFAATLGPGVMLSAIPVFLYQGAIVLAAGSVARLAAPEMIAAMNAAGGVLVTAIGLNVLEIKRIRVGNLLPALLVAALLAAF